VKYIASIQDFFLSPRWFTNLLLAGICTLIPVVGPMVVLGWLVGGFWGRDAYDAATFPDFDFSKFVKYLERGLWPMLVVLVASVVFMPLTWIACVVPIMGVSILAEGHHHSNAAAVMLVLLVVIVIVAAIVLSLLIMLVLKPLMLRATLTQNFAPAFDLRWAGRFLKRTWLECILAAIFLWVASIVLSLAGFLALCIGIYFVAGPIYFGMVHLDRQIYFLFLERGGDPVPASPKLRDEPPPIPAP